MKGLGEKFGIVVADDSPIYRKLLKDSLEESYAVHMAKDGKQALALVSEHKPAVLITDWEMPDLTGLEVCAQIRKDESSYTHVIILTSNSEKDKVVEALAAGADDYLTKPFHVGELLARVGVGIRIVELHREIQAKNRQLSELALTDALTGLPNRRALEEWASRELQSSQRHRYPFWVVIADLDHFKRVNDQYGHEAGDSVLCRFAEILRAHTRGADLCARTGGEEFVLAIRHVDKIGVMTVLERLRYRVEAENYQWGDKTVKITASFGVVCARKETKDLRQLLREADEALYAAKEKGRNLVEFGKPR